MAITATDVYGFLENYGVDNTVVSSEWIEKRITDTVDPFLKDKIGITTSQTSRTIVEWHEGTETNIMVLNYKPIISIDYIRRITPYDNEIYGSQLLYHVDNDKGIIYSNSIFTKNRNYMKDWEIKYTYGFAELIDPIRQACVMLLAELVLGHISSQTGGGNIGVQGVNRQYGRRGMYSDARDELLRKAYQLIRPYMSGVIG